MATRTEAMRSGWLQPKFWLGVLISVVCLYLAFQGVQWNALRSAMRIVDWRILILSAGVYVVLLWIRGLRWRTILAPLGPVASGEGFAYVVMGYMFNDLLPLRAGEVLRSLLLARKRHFSSSAVLATVVLERLADVSALALIVLLLLFGPNWAQSSLGYGAWNEGATLMPLPVWLKNAVLVAGLAVLAAMVGLWWLAPRSNLLHLQRGNSRGSQILIRVVDSTWARRLRTTVSAFFRGMDVLRSPAQVARVAGATAIIWLLSVGATWLTLRACQLDVPWTAALLVVVIVNFGAAVPSSPGFVGVVHLLAVAALAPWSVSKEAALTFAIIYHAVFYLITLVLGLFFLWREGLQWRQILDNKRKIADLTVGQ